MSTLTSVEFCISKPDVVEVYKLKKEAFPEFKAEWVANFDGGALPNGCHDIFLKVGIQGEKSHRILTNCNFV